MSTESFDNLPTIPHRVLRTITQNPQYPEALGQATYGAGIIPMFHYSTIPCLPTGRQLRSVAELSSKEHAYTHWVVLITKDFTYRQEDKLTTYPTQIDQFRWEE